MSAVVRTISQAAGVGSVVDLPIAETELPWQNRTDCNVSRNARQIASQGEKWRGVDMPLNLELNDFQRIVGHLPEFPLEVEKSAFLVVDMHYFQAHRDYGFGRKARELGLGHVMEYYYGRLQNLVLPRLQQAIPRLRDAGSQVIFVRVVSEKENGADFCLRYRAWGLKIPKDSRDADILDEIAPMPQDIVLNKTTQNVFLSTNLDQILRNLGCEYLIVAGVVTNNCVEAAVRTAADYSYKTFVLEDCCAAFTESAHEHALKNMHLNFGMVTTSADLQLHRSHLKSVAS